MTDKKITAEAVDNYMAGLVDIIVKNGWAVQGVGGGENSPAYAYTVGLSRNTPYELIIMDVPMQSAMGILNAAARQIIDNKLSLSDAMVFTDIANFPIHMRAVPNEQVTSVCTMVRKLNPAFNEVKFFQLVWPDEKGHYPGDKDCADWVTETQDIAKFATK